MGHFAICDMTDIILPAPKAEMYAVNPQDTAIQNERELVLEQFIPYRLATLSHAISHSIANVYDKRFGLSIPEWRVVAILGRFPGLSAVEVAERTMMDKVAVSRAVSKLIKSGRIDREFADADRRRSILTLSDNGREVFQEIAPLALELEHSLLDGLSDDEVSTLKSMMDRLFEKADLETPLQRIA